MYNGFKMLQRLKSLPITTFSVLLLNLFWIIWLTLEIIYVFFITKQTNIGSYDYVMILPGSLLGWVLLLVSTLLRKNQPLKAIYLELTMPFIVGIFVIGTSLINSTSGIGASVLDFSSFSSAIISLLLLFAVMIPQTFFLALPNLIIWVAWGLNLADSLRSLLTHHKTNINHNAA